MRVKITTDRQPWIDGAPVAQGDEVTVTDEQGRALLALGFAEAMDAPKARKRGASDDQG